MFAMDYWRACYFAFISVIILNYSTCEFDIYNALENVPDAERLDFLKYHINLGYEMSKPRETARELTVRRMEVSDTLEPFPVRMYKWAVHNHSVNITSTPHYLRDVICFDNGQCIDLGDVGVHP